MAMASSIVGSPVKHQHLDTGRDDEAEHAFGHEGSLAKEPEGHEDEAGERRQLEFDQRDEELDGEDEEGEQHDHPGEEQDRDLDEIVEEGDEAHEVAHGLKQRSSGLEPDLGDAARLQKLTGTQRTARGDQPQSRETLEDDTGELIPVADDVGEDADEERLLDEPRDDVVIRTPGPEERGQRDVDGDERGREEGDVAAEQSEAAIDIAGEDVQEPVDDTDATHGLFLLPARPGTAGREEAPAVLGPGLAADSVGLDLLHGERAAPPERGAQRIVGRFRHRRGHLLRGDGVPELEGGGKSREAAETEGDEPQDMIGTGRHGQLLNMRTVVGR
jgi:hypothetical protein